jgi:hypothetical protein
VTAAVTGAFLTEAGRPVRAPEAFREKLATLHVPCPAAQHHSHDDPAARGL